MIFLVFKAEKDFIGITFQIGVFKGIIHPLRSYGIKVCPWCILKLPSVISKIKINRFNFRQIDAIISAHHDIRLEFEYSVNRAIQWFVSEYTGNHAIYDIQKYENEVQKPECFIKFNWG